MKQIKLNKNYVLVVRKNCPPLITNVIIINKNCNSVHGKLIYKHGRRSGKKLL